MPSVSLRSVFLAVALLLRCAPHIGAAQSIPAVGTEATLDVATWNIEWFGNASNGPSDDDLQVANVRAVIEQADIDLWGVQEIADPDDFAALLDALGDGYDGVLATESSQQRIGFIYKTDVFSRIVAGHILTDFDHAFATRPPLQLEADVTLPDTTVRLTFIVLHMKCCGDQDDYERRADASNRLKNRIDFTSQAQDPIIILGDFNDELGGSIASGNPSPYENFLDDPDDYAFLTLPLDQQNVGTYCNNAACTSGSTLDHILITNELFTAYQSGSADRFDELVSEIDNYTFTTSDHLPVFARFQFSIDSATDDEAVPVAVTVEAPYPNPFRAATTLRYTLARPGPVRLDVFDALGRRVATPLDAYEATGPHRVTVDASGLPPGLYLLRLTAGGAVVTRQVVQLP